MTHERITVEPGKMGGVPCIRGLRIPVATVARLLDRGIPDAQILDMYPDLEAADLDEVRRHRRIAEAIGQRPRGNPDWQPLSPGEPTTRMEVKLPASLHEAARARAQAEGVSLAELVRTALERELGRTERGG